MVVPQTNVAENNDPQANAASAVASQYTPSGPSPSSAASGPPLEVVAPVLQDAADAVGGTAEALMVDEGVARLNSDGDRVYMRVTGQVSVAAEIGVGAGYGGDIAITQRGAGENATYSVTVRKEAVASLTGTIPIPNLPLKGDLGIQTFDTVEMRFDTPEEAARAAKIVQRLAIADAAGDVASVASNAALPGTGGGNPLANPLNESGAPGVGLQNTIGVTDDDRNFLQSSITAYEQTLSGRAGAAIEAKLPQLVSPLELAGEARLGGGREITRRVELPTDTEAGSLTYSIAEKASLTGKEKVTLGFNAGNQAVAGVAVQNRFEFASGQMSLSATWDIPAGTDVVNSPIGGRPVPEVNLITEGDLGAPDQITAEISTRWRDQSLATISRGDTNGATLTLEINDPASAGAALRAFVDGDPREAANLADATLTGEVQSVKRTGLSGQAGVKLQAVEGVKIDGSVILEAGVDDVVGTRSITFDGRPENAIAPAEKATPEERLVVTPRDGLALRDAADGEWQATFQHGTFVEPIEDAVVDANGKAWIPVRGTDLHDQTATGFVSADYVRPHDSALGAMDETGRTNPTLEDQNFREIAIQEGDNLWDIAQREGVDFGEMVSLNKDHLIQPDLIFEGDKIYVPGTAQPDVQVEAPEQLLPPSTTTETTGETNVDGIGSVPLTASPIPPSLPLPPTLPVSPNISTDSGGLGSGSTDSGPTDTEAPAPAAPPAADPTPAGGRGDLDAVLTEYQVNDAEMTTWQPKATPDWAEGPVEWAGENLGWIPGIGPSLERAGERVGQTGFEIPLNEVEAELLNQLGPVDQINWSMMAQDTYETAQARFPQPDGNDMSLLHWNNNGHTDAFRHALWNARMTQSFGEDWTEAYATAHEMVPGNEAAREAMDLYNHEVGRRIAVENPGASDAQLQDLIADAMDRGDLLVVNSDGDLAWSNQVAYGEHGQPRPLFLDGNDELQQRALEQGDPNS